MSSVPRVKQGNISAENIYQYLDYKLRGWQGLLNKSDTVHLFHRIHFSHVICFHHTMQTDLASRPLGSNRKIVSSSECSSHANVT